MCGMNRCKMGKWDLTICSHTWEVKLLFLSCFSSISRGSLDDLKGYIMLFISFATQFYSCTFRIKICHTIRKWLKLYYLNAASGRVENIPASTRTFSEILSDLQRSKISIKDWSLSDLTIGLYLIYLSQASSKNSEAFKGVQISSNKMVRPAGFVFTLKFLNCVGVFGSNKQGLPGYAWYDIYDTIVPKEESKRFF